MTEAHPKIFGSKLLNTENQNVNHKCNCQPSYWVLLWGYENGIKCRILPFILKELSHCCSRVNYRCVAVPWLRRLVAGLSPQRPKFDPGSVYVGFVMDKVSMSFYLCSITRKNGKD